MLPSIFPESPADHGPAILALADGTIFRGRSIGADGFCTAPVVFNTAMAGYQEALSDPNLNSQILAFTYPHIGNTGINPQDFDSARLQVAGVVLRDCPQRMSNFRATQTLPEALRANGVMAIAGIDTRMLTRRLRSLGTQAACILSGEDAARAVELARAHQAPSAPELGARVAVSAAQRWSQGPWRLQDGFAAPPPAQYRVLAYDLGIGHDLLRMLAARGCELTIVPPGAEAGAQLAQYDGLLLGNGPADPAECPDAIALARAAIAAQMPVFGLGQGMQIIALAAGAQTKALHAGHHGANHPVRELATGRVAMSLQSQRYCVDHASLPETVRASYVSLLDKSLQGIQLADAPACGLQGLVRDSSAADGAPAMLENFIGFLAARRTQS